MRCLDRMLLAAMLPILVASLAACTPDGPGTSVQVALAYDDALGLDTADVTFDNRTLSAPIAHQLLLLVSDDLAGSEMPIAVWGRKASMRAAYGTATAVPIRGKTVETELSLTACTPGCQGDTLMTCVGAPKTCMLGCSEDGDAHCVVPSASNGIDTTLVDTLSGMTMISAATVFDTDSGAITGDISRPAGTGINAGIGYFQAPASGTGGAALGIFAFHSLGVDGTATIRFIGARAAVFLVGDTAAIGGVIDVSGGRGARAAPGPGGGAGGASAAPAGGCGAGAAGGHSTATNNDGGGGGAGAGETGAPGGGLSPTIIGMGGAACLPPLLEPLQGGGGGGAGGAGSAALPAAGGGGGGAFQITSLRVLVITGTITAGGAGGDAGPLSAMDGGAGAGGGAGGALLLEAPMVTIAGSAIIAANGGGGGGGGGGLMQTSEPGGDGAATDAFAQGGFGTEGDNGGGTGGSVLSPPDVGRDGETNGNAGGGGAGAGRIVVRGHSRLVSGKFSPTPMQADVKPPQ